VSKSSQPKLSGGVAALAAKIQESVTKLSQRDVQTRLQDALQDAMGDQEMCCWVVDVFGDDQSGDLVYSEKGDLKRCSYEISGSTVTLDMESAVEVLPTTTYEEQVGEMDHMAAMEARVLHFDERFVSKSEREQATAGDFAGKGKSFPILKPEDIAAAVRSMGRAGAENYSTDVIRGRIIAIAKRKGWAKYLPSAWQTGANPKESENIEITGDILPLVALREGGSAVASDGTAHLKLIAPGWGTSGYYSREVLERDGPQVFPRGTKMFWDHQTSAEESARPEGSLRDLASELVEDARYDEKGPAGPGLYARAKVFEQYRGAVNELAPHIGVSIRALGLAKPGEAEGRKGQLVEKLTRGQSVDYVTQPGAGGKILQLFEAARAATIPHQGGADDMDAAELKKLQETQERRFSELTLENRRLRERFAVSDAADAARQYFAGVRVAEAVQSRVSARLLAGTIPLTETGDLDRTKFLALVEAETKDETAYIARLSEGRIVSGMGAPPAADTDPAKQAAAIKESMAGLAKAMGISSEAGLKAFTEGTVA
jgi:hypothetical protein